MFLKKISALLKFLALFLLSIFFYLFADIYSLIIFFLLGLFLLLRLADNFQKFIRMLLGIFVIGFFVFIGLLFGKGMEEAILGVLRMWNLYLFASLAAISTTFIEMHKFLELLLRPLRFLGVNVDKISLLVLLVLRFVQLIRIKYDEACIARYSRGLDYSFIALFLPLLVRILYDIRDVSMVLRSRFDDDSF